MLLLTLSLSGLSRTASLSAQSLSAGGREIGNTVLGGGLGGFAGLAAGTFVANQMRQGPRYRPSWPVTVFTFTGAVLGGVGGYSDGVLVRAGALGGLAGSTLGFFTDLALFGSGGDCCAATPLGFAVGTAIGFFWGVTRLPPRLNYPNTADTFFIVFPQLNF